MKKNHKPLIILVAMAITILCCEKEDPVSYKPVTDTTFDPNEGQTNWVKIPYNTINWNTGNIYYEVCMNDVEFVNENVGYIIGHSFFHEPGLVIYKTYDGGTTWKRLSCPSYGAGSTGYAILFFNECSGYFSDIGMGIPYEYETTDGGQSWSNRTISGSEFYIAKCHIDSQHGILGMGKTDDAGTTWNYIGTTGNTYPNKLTSYSFLGTDYGLFSTNAGLIGETYDFGDTWHELLRDSTCNFHAIEIIDSSTFIAGGNKLLKTNDKGLTWNVKYEGDYVMDIKFINNQVGFAVTKISIPNNDGDRHYSGKILKTTDGGETWTENYVSSFLGFTSLAVLNEQTIIAVGVNGNNEKELQHSYIVKTTTQGN